MAVDVGELGFRFCERPLGVEQGERIHLTLALLGADDLRGDFGLVARGLQGFAPAKRAGIGRQRGFRFFERAKHRSIELGERFLAACFGARHSRPRPRMVAERPADQRAEQEDPKSLFNRTIQDLQVPPLPDDLAKLGLKHESGSFFGGKGKPDRSVFLLYYTRVKA